MSKPTIDEIIEERSKKAAECYVVAEVYEGNGASEQASAFKMSAEYAAAAADYLRELRDSKKPH